METRYEEKNKRNGRRFKSYYVVWKHFTSVKQSLSYNGLNRTMQYGNTIDQLSDARRAEV